MFKIYSKASDLPKEWDLYTKNPFQKREFLIFLEEVNPCNQKYHINFDDNIILITYKLKLNILSFFNKFELNIPIDILGIPLSVATNGYSCPSQKLAILQKYIETFGLLLILNTDGKLNLPTALTFPNFIVKAPKSLDDHLSKMRSHYRYRAKKALSRRNKLQFEKIKPQNFSQKLYSFYEEVFERSEGKLEKLSIDFFRKCDADLYKILNEHSDEIGFFQCKEIDNNLVFLFCGFDHSKNKTYDLYLNILLKLIELGTGTENIHFGQTTEYSKSRLGAFPHYLYLHLQSKYIPKTLCHRILNLLGNKPVLNELNCMK